MDVSIGDDLLLDGVLRLRSGTLTVDDFAIVGSGIGANLFSAWGQNINARAFAIGRSANEEGIANISNSSDVVVTADTELGRALSSTGSILISNNSTWTTGEDMLIGINGSATVTISTGADVICDRGFIGETSFDLLNFAIGRLTVRDDGSTWTSNELVVGSFVGNGILQVENGGLVNINGPLAVSEIDSGQFSSGGMVSLEGDGSTIQCESLSVGDGESGEMILAAGTIVNCYHATIGSQNGAYLEVNSALFSVDDDLTIIGQQFVEANINSGGLLDVGGQLVVDSGSLMVSNAMAQAKGGLINNSFVHLSNNGQIVGDTINNSAVVFEDNVQMVGDMVNHGTISVRNISEVVFSAGTFLNEGVCSTLAYGITRIEGAASGSGIYGNSGLVQFVSTFAPGNSAPASIDFEGDVVLASNAALSMEINGVESGLFDQLVIDGNLTIESNRTLEVELANNFELAESMQFLICDVGGGWPIQRYRSNHYLRCWRR